MNNTIKFFTALIIAFIANQFICLMSAQAQSTTLSGTTIPQMSATLPPTFFVSPNGDNDPVLGGTSWEHAWTDFNQVSWALVQQADALSAKNFPGGMQGYPGAVSGDTVTCVVEIDGGPWGSHITYNTSCLRI
jgi:hypothetical protein